MPFRRMVMQALVAPLASRVAPVYMSQNRRYAAYDIGAWTYGKPEVVNWGTGATLKIGRFCSIARGVKIMLVADHRVDWVTTYPFSSFGRERERFPGHPTTRGDVMIGHDVWIAENALILSGVTIGNGAVVGAGSVVTRDVAPYAIVAGNPAQHRKHRFDEDTIAALQEIAWWDWPLPKVKEAWPLLLSPNVDAFIATYKSTESSST